MQNGKLYVVATPLGNLADISQRAIDVLSQVDCIAAEDTRHSRKLLQHYHIQTRLISLHEYNERGRVEELIKRLQTGQSIAIISDAGTPLISDPGYQFVVAAHETNITVIPIPGPCAAIAALSAAGLPADNFLFIGFLPVKISQRQQQLEKLATSKYTLIFYEAPHRIVSLLESLQKIFGAEHMAVLAKEITKQYETIKRGPIAYLHTWLTQAESHSKGEFVIIVAGQKEKSVASDEEAHRIVKILANELPPAQAAKLASKITHINKQKLYDDYLT